MIVINKLLTFLSPMDLLIPVLLFSLVSSPFFVEALHAPINTTRTFTAQPPPSFQKQANLGVKSAKVFSFSGNSNAGVAPPLPPLPPQAKAKPWDVRNSYQIPQQGIFPPIQQRKPNVPPLFQRNNQPNQLMPQTFNRNQLLRAGSSGFPAKQQPFIVTTPIPTPSPDTLGGSQVRFNFKAAKARQAQLARMRTTSPKPSPPAKKNINTSSFNRFDRFNRFKKPRNKQKFKKPTTPKPEKKYVSGNGVQYTDLSKIAKDGSYMGNQDPLYVYSTTTAPPPTYPPTQPPYQRPYRNNYQNNYYQTTTYGYQYYQTTNNYNYDPYYQGQYQNNNAPYQGNNQQYQGPNNQQYQGNYQGYATTTPYYQDQGYQNQGQYNQGYQNQEGYQYTTPPYYPPAQPNNQAYQNNYGPSAGTQQGGNYPQNYSGNQTYSNHNYPGQDPNAQYQPQPQGPVQNTQYQPPPANQGPPSNQGTNTQYQPPPGNQGSNAPYQPPPANQAPNAQYQPPSANLAPNTPYQPPPENQGSNAPYQPPPGNQGSNTQYQPPPANQAPNAQYPPPSADLAPNTPYQPPPGNQGSNAPYQPPPGNQGPNTQYQPPPANQGPNAQYQPPPGNQVPPMNQGPNNQYAPPLGIQGLNTQSLPPTGIQAPINQGPPVNPGANGQYQPPPGSQGVNGQYQPPPGAQGPNTQYRPPSGAQGPPPVQGQAYQPAQPAQPYPPQGNPPYQTNPQQGAQQPQNISSNAPYQYQPGQGYNDNYIPPKSGGAGSSPEQSWVRIDNIMTTVKPPSNERWVQVGSIKPTWTTQSTITVNQNKKVQDTTTRAPPDVAGWSDPAPNPNDINLEIIGDTLLDTPIEITKSLDINMTSETSVNTGSDKPLRGDIQIEKAVKGNVTTDGKSNVSRLESNAKLKTDKNMSKDPPKPKTTTTSTTTTSTTTTPKPTTTTPKPTTTTPKPTTTTPKPTTTTKKPTTTTLKPTTPKPTTTTPKPTTTTPKPTTTTTPKPTTKKPTTTTTTTTKAPTTTTTTTKRPKVSSMHYKIENQASSQQIKETKPHVSVDVKEKITKQSTTSVKIDTSRMPNSENPTNRILAANNNQSRVQTSAQRGVYVQQKPVLKDSHRYGPPRQDYRGPQYDVKAAAVDSHRMNNIGTTIFPPDLTTLPIYPTTKSFWDSLFSFTPTTPYPGNKPGSCPTAFALMFDCHNVCSHDSHCYGRQKCCHGGRGTGCCARPETMDVGFNNLLMPYMMAEGQGQGQGGQNNRFFGEILKKK
ncbi:proteoglycan 4-like isoform X1 [Crassostrea angulata]|uniref:proteoglycan 4-like isoform X1 n=1 Tax=Magallana angulata TaxID=2784310 RepID=UPI0022B15D42|nr:proteoglycan 4-like isoform X1 [Crassostrea angulata]